ncbi:MAG TPA: hypothetical protein VI386_12140 [Candidatus Sulfotelmatobacter sp.]
MTVEEQVLEKLRDLPLQRQREVLAFVSRLREQTGKAQRKSLRGLWADMNITLGDQDIVEARLEMWGSFPRDI